MKNFPFTGAGGALTGRSNRGRLGRIEEMIAANKIVPGGDVVPIQTDGGGTALVLAEHARTMLGGTDGDGRPEAATGNPSVSIQYDSYTEEFTITVVCIVAYGTSGWGMPSPSRYEHVWTFAGITDTTYLLLYHFPHLKNESANATSIVWSHYSGVAPTTSGTTADAEVANAVLYKTPGEFLGVIGLRPGGDFTWYRYVAKYGDSYQEEGQLPIGMECPLGNGSVLPFCYYDRATQKIKRRHTSLGELSIPSSTSADIWWKSQKGRIDLTLSLEAPDSDEWGWDVFDIETDSDGRLISFVSNRGGVGAFYNDLSMLDINGIGLTDSYSMDGHILTFRNGILIGHGTY